MAERGKKYLEAVKQFEPDKLYTPQEGIELARKAKFAKFDETVELHIKTGLDPRNADQQLRGVTTLPNGLGKKIRILVMTQGEGFKLAEDAGADYVGADEFIKKIEDGWLDFDVVMATPDMMGKVGKLGRILGKKGLMPNPKAGTVVPPNDLPRVIKEARKGRVEFKMDRSGIIHLPIGKASFEQDKLVENLASIIEAIVKAKPSGAKGQYIKSATVKTTMGPPAHIDLKALLSMTSA